MLSVSAMSSGDARGLRPGCFANALVESLLVGVEVLDRVRVEFATVLLDRLADLPWVGREQERREVEEVRLQVEEITNAGPAPEVGDGFTLVGGAARAAKQRRPCEGRAEPEELAPAEASVVIEGSASLTSTLLLNRCTLLSNMIALRAVVCIVAVRSPAVLLRQA